MHPILFQRYSSYKVINSVGTVLGILAYLFYFYKKDKDKRQVAGNFLCVLFIILMGEKASKFVRTLNNGEFSSIAEAFRVGIFEGSGSHFIGRVLFTAWIYPFGYAILRYIYEKKWKLLPDVFSTLNALSFYFVIQHIFNRIACLCYGCCYGCFYNGIGAIRFPGMAYSVFPTQFMEILFMVILLGYLYKSDKKGGFLYGRMLIGFGGAIFISEFFMDRIGITKYMNLTVIQICALLTLITGGLYMYKMREKKEREG